ncbi:MAG: 50S ribosomal protein L3 [Acidobacteria bacterium]|nr:50S ribosomal protein L3 [Acidobacteriota bacterium]
MVKGLIGRKVGMTHLFRDDGRVVPVTVLRAGPCVVVQRKTSERDGYEAAQLGLVEARPVRHANKATAGHHAKAGVPPTRVLREFDLAEGQDPKPGDTVTCELFAPGDKVEILGTSKGHGFQGVIKRHHYRGGAATHGSMFHRAPGSVGASAWPSRTFAGTRLPGQMGGKNITVKGLEVVKIDAQRNLLMVRGAVPGAAGSLVVIRRARGGAAAKAE